MLDTPHKYWLSQEIYEARLTLNQWIALELLDQYNVCSIAVLSHVCNISRTSALLIIRTLERKGIIVEVGRNASGTRIFETTLKYEPLRFDFRIIIDWLIQIATVWPSQKSIKLGVLAQLIRTIHSNKPLNPTCITPFLPYLEAGDTQKLSQTTKTFIAKLLAPPAPMVTIQSYSFRLATDPAGIQLRLSVTFSNQTTFHRQGVFKHCMVLSFLEDLQQAERMEWACVIDWSEELEVLDLIFVLFGCPRYLKR